MGPMGATAASPPVAGSARQVSIANLSCMLTHASHVLHTQIAEALEDIGISPRAYWILAEALTGEFTQTELAHSAGIDKTTMVVTLDELEAAGLAKRTPDPRDRRARVIAVTKAGERKVAKGAAVVEAIHADLLDALTAEQRDGLLTGLAHLVENQLSTPGVCSQPVRRPRE